jgi:AcrR family transcriptional regulator
VPPSNTREAKRDTLIGAAVELLLSEGVAGCTTRAIAEKSGMPRGSIHYYFEDTEQLVELAWKRLMGGFYGELENAADTAAGPLEAVWAVADAYLRLGSRATSQVPLVAFEYLVVAKRKGRLDGPQAVLLAHRSLLTRVLTAADVGDPDAVAANLHRSLVGALIHQEIAATETETVLREIMAPLGIHPPAVGNGKANPSLDIAAGGSRGAKKGSTATN